MTDSTDEALTTSFVQAFCDALADSLTKAAQSKSSPKELLERMTSRSIDTPTKIPTKAAKPKQIASPLQDKLALRSECLWWHSYRQENEYHPICLSSSDQ
jgi:hypothetical protein